MRETTQTNSYRNLLRLRIPDVGEPVFRARARLAAVASRLGFRGETQDAILLAFSEAITNALVHGCSATRRCVHASVGVLDGRLLIEVRDHGTGFHPDRVDLPPPDCMCEGGRGLFLMRALMDEVQWIATPDGTTVRMTKRLASQPSPAGSLPAAQSH